MIWIYLALVLAIPAWLGLTRPGHSAPRRFIGRALLSGVALGALWSVTMWLMSPHAPTGLQLLYGPIGGGAAGAALGLLVGLPWMLRRRTRHAGGGMPAE